MLLLEKQITEIDRVTHVFFGEKGADVAIDRHLRPKTHGVVLVDPKERGPEEHLVRCALRDQ